MTITVTSDELIKYSDACKAWASKRCDAAIRRPADIADALKAYDAAAPFPRLLPKI